MGPAANEIVIDLGEMPDEEFDELPTDRRARWARPWLTALSVVALIGGVGAAAPPPPPSAWETPFVLASSRTGYTHTVTAGELLVVAEPGNGAVAAWDLTTGRKRWSFPSLFTELSSAEIISGVLVVTAARRTPGTEEEQENYSTRTYGIDPATGRLFWELPGNAFLLGDDRGLVLLLDQHRSGMAFAVINPVTGTEQWRRVEDDDLHISFSQQTWLTFRDGGSPGDAFLNNWRVGDLFQLSLTTGELLSLGRLAPRSSIMDFDDQMIIADVTEDQDNDPGNGFDASYVVVYDRTTLAELWRTPNRALSGGSYLNRCGGLICETNGTGTTAREWRTGREIWSSTVSPFDVWRRPGGDLLIAQRSSSPELVLLDPATGREVMGFGGWQLIGFYRGDLLMMLHPDRPDERNWFGLLPAIGELRLRPLAPFGPAGGRPENCEVMNDRLSCRISNELLVVDLAEAWQVKR